MKVIRGIIQNALLITLALLASNVILAKSTIKIDAALRTTLARNGHANILVSMKAGTEDILNDLASKSFSSRTERSQAVYDALTARAQHSQSKILTFLASASTLKQYNYGNVQSFWITNQIGIQVANEEFIAVLAYMDEISLIQEDDIAHGDHPIEEIRNTTDPEVQWGIDAISAPAAWLLFNGTSGSGITVANIDTGVRYTHQILIDTYKNDNHSWYDPYNQTEIPADYHGHGTHTMGTIVGRNGYGVAPQASWIACKGLYDDNFGSGLNLLACGQFMVCPTTFDGLNADCSKTPHIVSNSWGTSVGASTYYDGLIAAWHAAGIIPVFSLGNSGTNCGTARSPGDRNVIGVGSTTILDQLSVFSSVGPTRDHGIKPDISAPGTSVESAGHLNDTAYRTMSGTSMACPHVAGTIALLLSRNGNLTYFEVKTLLQSYADRDLSFSNSVCDYVSDEVFPNHHFGYGRLNTNNSLAALVESSSNLTNV